MLSLENPRLRQSRILRRQGGEFLMTGAGGAKAELRIELLRIAEALEGYLIAKCETDRGGTTDPIRGMAIEECEAKALVKEVATKLAMPIDYGKVLENSQPKQVIQSPSVGPESPLHRIRRVFQLGCVEYDAMLLASAVELDQRFARVVAFLNDHVSRTRPTVGLALSVIGSDMSAVEFCASPAVAVGLLIIEGDVPLSAAALRLRPEFLSRLAAPEITDHLPENMRLTSENTISIDEVALGETQREQLRRWAAGVTGAASPPLLLAGPAGAGRATAARAASASIGRSLVEFDWTLDRGEGHDGFRAAAREALWRDATLLVRVPEGAKDADLARLWTALSRWDIPVALTLSPHLIESACAAAPVEPMVVHLDRVSVKDREILWHRLLADTNTARRSWISESEITELAARYDFLPGVMVRSIRRAEADCNGAAKCLDFESLSHACRAVGSAGMRPIAQRLPQPFTRSDLVLPLDLLQELDLASSWIRYCRHVFDEWGFGQRIALGRGLTALFAGEPGTGKTMAAQVLARELGMELFRVDLSRVMSKYIGETEKNISQLFDDAQASGAILFFDEADALFGKRTEVRDAHDRYANVEVSYLLQRMEEHLGATVLATNRVGDMDDAFIRRFHFILRFPMPRAEDRLRIWKGMLPHEAEKELPIQLEELARDYEISGGEIRNAVLSAAFMAANEGKPIAMRHLRRGLGRELLKTGRILDTEQRKVLLEPW
jgi:MoxR-like ATPase